MSDYWDQRYQNEGMIWGETASPTADHARQLFAENGAKTVLVPGAGYGRNTRAFSAEFLVDAIELSPDAIELARKFDPRTTFIEGSALDHATGKTYDGIYCYDLIHLFEQMERDSLTVNLIKHLGEKGLLYITCFSDEDANCGLGKETEPGTYEYKPGKLAHFFSEEDLRRHFAGLTIVETGSVDEVLTNLAGETHTYRLRYLVATNVI
ncbi:class I SAM-dependent methyltransferase [Gorillibacterium massiliense]|uniref:class I SAM-dependent methyltransferase n=1 Tax=Gorillibacterium massiliense TaxID=1280390 RepID=UPI0004B48F01|nr:methyltransferase domain-containing protein [Gorillibacterium massiliense]